MPSHKFSRSVIIARQQHTVTILNYFSDVLFGDVLRNPPNRQRRRRQPFDYFASDDLRLVTEVYDVQSIGILGSEAITVAENKLDLIADPSIVQTCQKRGKRSRQTRASSTYPNQHNSTAGHDL